MKRNGIILLIGCLNLTAIGSCNHHKADIAYPACNTTNVSLSKDLRPILVANCYNCHSAVNAPTVGSNFSLEDYNKLMIWVDTIHGNGTLIQAIKHDSSLSAPWQFMPKNGSP